MPRQAVGHSAHTEHTGGGEGKHVLPPGCSWAGSSGVLALSRHSRWSRVGVPSNQNHPSARSLHLSLLPSSAPPYNPPSKQPGGAEFVTQSQDESTRLGEDSTLLKPLVAQV